MSVASTSKDISFFMIKQNSTEDNLICAADLTPAHKVVKHHQSQSRTRRGRRRQKEGGLEKEIEEENEDGGNGGDKEEDTHPLLCSDPESDTPEESEDLLLNFDVGNWPIPVPDGLRTEIIRRGSENFQHLEGPFGAVQKPGENPKGHTRQLNSNWFYKQLPSGEKILRKWMVYSTEKKSLFCFCCKLFDNNDIQATTSSFITGFNSWWKLNPKVSDHESSEFHVNNFEKWKTLEAGLLKKKTIDAAHQDGMERERKKWRDILHRLLDITLFLSKQNLPFRGHREDIDSDNRGNFLELVNLLSHYDPVLKEHSIRLQQSLEAGMIPVSYLSPAVQNEFISLLGNAVKKEIISEIKKAKYFGILFDSTPDISHTEQMSQVIRYVKIENRKVEVKESFLGFIPLSGKKAHDITEDILQSLAKDGLDIKLCRSQGYDNATTMSGVHTGVQKRIKEQNPKAIVVPCANHSLNLCGVHAFGSVPVCVTFFGTLECVYNMFSCSTHRWQVLKETVGVTVKRLCDTRWSAHHDAVKPIFKNFKKLVDAVDKLCDASENLDTRGAAELLMKNICNFNFLCFLHLWYHILQEVNHAQKYLQIQGISLEKCVLELRTLKSFVEESREELVNKSLEYATTTCGEMNIDIESRNRKRVKKMMPGENAQDAGLTPQQELKRSMLECIDKFHVELEKRLTSMNDVYEQFAVVHSENLVRSNDETIITHIHQFTATHNDLEEDEMLPEVKRL
ncbi:zinc finger MYM-type protein 1-like [Coccinella septempunctata]|uniref:zinc finger MYM-type protein 1-like n=1 Tax=Coccinella septempunctata TaxID=41139 RepID=UPI001D05CE01|nr:zinc finger MYM-type protein 1-like [Coccinella septempunctata]